jgi:hypothetical protein
MPGRAKRVAARQAELSRRKKKGKAKGPPAPPPRTVEVRQGVETRVTTSIPPPAPARRAAQRPPAYAFVVSEVRRIGILASIILAILIALSFLLR